MLQPLIGNYVSLYQVVPDRLKILLEIRKASTSGRYFRSQGGSEDRHTRQTSLSLWLMESGSWGLLLVTVSTPPGLVRSHLPWSCACSLFSGQPTEGKWAVQSACAMDEQAKDGNGIQLGVWPTFLLFLNSPLPLSRNSSQRSMSFFLRAPLVFALKKVRIRHEMQAPPHLTQTFGAHHPLCKEAAAWPIRPTNKTWVEFLCQDFRSDAHICRISMSKNPTNLSHSHTYVYK